MIKDAEPKYKKTLNSILSPFIAKFACLFSVKSS